MAQRIQQSLTARSEQLWLSMLVQAFENPVESASSDRDHVRACEAFLARSERFSSRRSAYCH